MSAAGHLGPTRILGRSARLLKPTPRRGQQRTPLPWICSRCYSSTNPRANSSDSSTATNEKPYYVTTPIFYANAAPHIGHMYSMLLADILKRWQILQGKKAILATGVDEHGMKVQRAAAKAETDPQAFCDQGAEMVKSIAQQAGISNDHFVRTTSSEHKEAVRHAWRVLENRGYIYSSKHEGWYSVSDETFYPSRAVELIVEPTTGRKIMTSIETGKEVEWTSEINYRFRLSEFRDRLLELYRNNPEFIVPSERKPELINELANGLEDLSVSRPTDRLDWGIRVPSDESQTIYVWLDALLNYATKVGYPWTPGKENDQGWPANCQVIGKDIMRFHCIYWPAFLMALDVALPKQILIHCHWTLGREKMAKSTGNVVNPFYAINRFGADVIRYYLAHDGRLLRDSDYSNEFIIERYQKHLQGDFGNLVSRLLRNKKWNVRNAIERMQSNHSVLENSEEVTIRAQYKLVQSLAPTFKERMDTLNTSTGLELIMSVIQKTNAFFTNMSPWQVATSTSEEDKRELEEVLFLCAETLRISGILLHPFMPEKSGRLLDMLGVDDSRRLFDWATIGADPDYGISRVELGTGYEHTLFPPLTARE